jgi:transposase
MPKSRPPYASEFRRQIIELVQAGRPPEELACEFEPSAQAIREDASCATHHQQPP